MNTLPLPPFDLPVTPEDRMLASTLTGGLTDAEITRSAQYIRQYVNAEKAALFIDKRTYIELAAEECEEKNRLIGVLTALYDAGHGELAWTNCGKGVRICRHTWFGLIRDSEQGEHFHPTQKPAAVMVWCIQKSKSTGDILDPYMGSGSTLVAAKSLGRRAVGIDLEEEYCETAANRCRQEILALT